MLNLVPQYNISVLKLVAVCFGQFWPLSYIPCWIFVTIQIFWDVTLVLWYTSTEVSKGASISTGKQCSNFLTLNMKSPLSLETSITAHPTTIRNMSEEWIFSNTAVRTSILTTCHVCNSTFRWMKLFLHRMQRKKWSTWRWPVEGPKHVVERSYVRMS